MRKISATSILVDAGDVMTGNPITEYIYKNAFGGALFEMMNMVGYEAWSPGNHDMDISQENLINLTRIATFPTVSANLKNLEDEFPVNNKPFVIKEKNGVKIGLIGIISEGLFSLVNKNRLTGIKVLPTVPTLQRLVDSLKPHTDILVALTHQGYEEDSVLATSINGLNVIVGGHSHTRLRKPKFINGIVVAQTGSSCENLGVVNVTVDNHTVTSHDGTLIQLWYNSARRVTQLSRFIDSVKTIIEKDYDEKIGTLTTDWIRTDGESNIGNFVTDAQREAAKADIGFTNNHGIRKDLKAGPITKRDLFEILPFQNELCTFTVTGKQIRDIISHYVTRRSSIQTSGIRCEYKKSDKGVEIVSLTVNGKSVDDNAAYTAAASDYFIGEGKRYLGFEIKEFNYVNILMFPAVEKKIRSEKTITSKVEGRIKGVN
jgi:2',3'-cyclic-nucleotide 2'-phosphodiesterase (5'-nucleotidase family)